MEKVLSNDIKKANVYTLACAGVFCSLMVLGAYQIIGAALHPDGLEYPKGAQNFREGVTTQTLEKQLDHKMPRRNELIAFANTIRYQLFGGSGDQVRLGKDGWLFLTEEIRYEGDDGKPPLNRPEESFQVRLDLIASIAKRLDTQGIRLVVALVPDKARIYETQLGGRGYPEYNTNRYAQALSELSQRKVHAIDLLSPLVAGAKEKAMYYKTDTHWNQDGAQLSAKVIAKGVAALSMGLEKTEFKTILGSFVQRPGDLLRLMGVDQVPQSLRPASDQEAVALTQAAKPSSASAGAGLFADEVVPVVLTGTSYSLRGNFHGYLQEFVGAKILNTAKDGGGFLQALTAYLKDDSFKSAKPKILIWELPERMLKSKLTDEKDWLKSIEPVL